MKRLKAAGLCLVAIVTVGSATASSASATLPEFLVSSYDCDMQDTPPINNIGQFITLAKCLDPAQTTEMAGKFWRLSAGLTGEGTEPRLHGVVAGGLIHINVACKNSSSHGEVPGGQSFNNVVVKYTECKVEGTGNACTTSGESSGTITTKTLSGTLGYLSKPTSGIALKPAEGTTVVTFTCEGTVGAVTIEGCAVEEIAPINSMKSTEETLFQENEAKTAQKWTKLEGGSECVLTVLAKESSGLAWVKDTQLQTNTKEIEVKA